MVGVSIRVRFSFWATFCKMVRPMLLDRCLSCLSVALVYCGQTVGWIKMKLGVVVGFGPGHIVLDGDPDPHMGTAPQLPTFSYPPKRSIAVRYILAHFYCGQTVADLSYC